jgi:conjugative transfer signal peptidase TraF
MTAVGRSEGARFRGYRDIGRIAVISAAALISAFGVAYGLGIRINVSASLPFGFYRIDGAGTSNLVEFCPPAPFGEFANSRGYRHAGTCPDGGSPLLKPVVAQAGDIVSTSAEGVHVNGRLLPNSAPRTKDTAGRVLVPWPFGTCVVQPGTLWVLSTYHPRSFDSRYFGPVPESAIRDRLRPLFTLK